MTKLEELKVAIEVARTERKAAWVKFCQDRDIAFAEYLDVCEAFIDTQNAYLVEQHEIKLKRENSNDDN